MCEHIGILCVMQATQPGMPMPSHARIPSGLTEEALDAKLSSLREQLQQVAGC